MVNVRDVVCPAGSLPGVGVTVSHGWDGAPAVHVNMSPPVFCRLMVCAVGLLPAVVVNVKKFALSAMWGEGMVIVMTTTDGLPVTARPVMGSIALMTMLVETVVPPGTPVALTVTLTVVFAPPARPVPEVAESETYLGEPAPSAAVQFKG